MDRARFSHNYHPCPLCRASKDDLVTLDDYSLDYFPFAKRTYDDFDAACRACEKTVVLSVALHQAIRTNLDYDRRDKGHHGRYLMAAIPGTILLAGDRLEPSKEIPDTGAGFDNLSSFPTTTTFWKCSAETWVYHRNPLWNRRMGFTYDKRMAVDWLHTIALGIFQFFIMAAMHQLFQADAWGTREATEECRNAASVDRMHSELTEHYREQKRNGVNVTEITDLNATTFGTKRKPACHLKGAETNHFMPYLDSLLARFHALLPDPDAWQQASASTLRIAALIREHREMFPVYATQEPLPFTPSCGIG